MGFQRATRFQAGLPIAARYLFLTHLLSLLGALWLPALAGGFMILAATGRAHAAAALAVVEAAAIFTLVIAALQSIRMRELCLPRWLMIVLMVPMPPVSLLVTRYGSATIVFAVSLPLSAVLLLRTWRALPKSYELAPAGTHPGTAAVPKAGQRAKTSVRFLPAVAWRPVLHSLFSARDLWFLPWILVGAMSGQWLMSSLCTALLWFNTRQRSRWLWSLPIKARALLLTMLVPILFILAAGYFAGLHFPRKHPIPVPDFNLQVLSLGLILGCALLALLCMVLFDWRRLGRFPKWVRALPALLFIGLPWFVPGVLFLFVPSAMDQFARVQREFPLTLSHAVPGGVFGALAATAATLAVLYWAIEKVSSEAEFANKPRPPQDYGFLAQR
jgi:hypothetical protein